MYCHIEVIVTKLLTPVGNTNAPAVSVVVPDIISVLLDIVVPVEAVGLFIVNAATLAGNNVPVTCDAVALLKVTDTPEAGNVFVPLVVSVPLIPPTFAVVNEPAAESVKFPEPLIKAVALAITFNAVRLGVPVPLKSTS